MANEMYGEMQDAAYQKANSQAKRVDYKKMAKEKLIASLQVARGELDRVTEMLATKASIYDSLKAQYVAVSRAADEEYQKFLREKNDLAECNEAQRKQIARLTEDFVHFSNAIRIVKTVVNGIVIQGEDKRDPRLTGK